MKKIGYLLLIGWLFIGTHLRAQETAGIGIALGKDGNDLVVKQVLPGSPAASSKQLYMNDRIIAVGQNNDALVNVDGLEISKAVQMIRGPKGSVVRLKVVPSGKNESEAKVGSLVRDEIKGIKEAAPQKVDAPAPEIEGEDVDGKKFKLSDYRGKVVMIDFWGDW